MLKQTQEWYLSMVHLAAVKRLFANYIWSLKSHCNGDLLLITKGVIFIDYLPKISDHIVVPVVTIFQDHKLIPTKTVAENIAYAMEMDHASIHMSGRIRSLVAAPLCSINPWFLSISEKWSMSPTWAWCHTFAPSPIRAWCRKYYKHHRAFTKKFRLIEWLLFCNAWPYSFAAHPENRVIDLAQFSHIEISIPESDPFKRYIDTFWHEVCDSDISHQTSHHSFLEMSHQRQNFQENNK